MSAFVEKTVLAIDPGTHKCGIALVKRSEEGALDLLWRDIIPVDAVLPKIHEAYVHAEFHLIIVGSSTGSKPLVEAIRSHLPGMGLLVIDERETTIQARERYWEHHPRKGWRRFWPASLQVPPEPYDDFAAYVIAERVLTES